MCVWELKGLERWHNYNESNAKKAANCQSVFENQSCRHIRILPIGSSRHRCYIRSGFITNSSLFIFEMVRAHRTSISKSVMRTFFIQNRHRLRDPLLSIPCRRRGQSKPNDRKIFFYLHEVSYFLIFTFIPRGGDSSFFECPVFTNFLYAANLVEWYTRKNAISYIIIIIIIKVYQNEERKKHMPEFVHKLRINH